MLVANHKIILEKLNKDVKVRKLSAVAKDIGIPYTTLSDIIKKGEVTGTLRTWSKIEYFYYHKESKSNKKDNNEQGNAEDKTGQSGTLKVVNGQ